MSALQVTAIYIAVNILMLVWLAFRVVTWRRKAITAKDVVADELALAARVHGNASEYIPGGMIGLLTIALIAPAGPVWVLHTLGGMFTLGRAMHAYGFGRSIILLRQIGIILTWLAMLGMVAALAWYALV